MCHLILLMPVLGIPLFWLLPPGYAIPINASIWLMSGFLYWLITRALKKPLADDGFHSLVGTEAEVVSKQALGHSARYLIRPEGEGELWSAYSMDILDVGERVNIVALRGIGVVVERTENGPSHVETKLAGAQDNKRHRH